LWLPPPRTDGGDEGGDADMSDRSRDEVIRSNPNLRLLALPREEAAAEVGMHVKTFDKKVRPELRAIRDGKTLLFPVAELERWLDENAEKVLTEAA
jgi:hypothetical protein